MGIWADRVAKYRQDHPDAVRREYCEHGLEYGKSALAGHAFAGAIGYCECHKAIYGYVDSGGDVRMTDGTIRIFGTRTDSNLCKPCGGKRHEYEYETKREDF